MKPILARMSCLVLGLAVLELLPGCASSGDRGAPGTELNPKVTGEVEFTGFKSGPRVVFEVEVEQTEPMIIRPHTWAVRAWMSESNSPEVTPDTAAWIMADPVKRCAPDLKAGCDEIEIRFWDCDVRLSTKYISLVVEVVEMTGGNHPTVYATKTYARTFENGVQHKQEVEIPLCTDANMHAQAAALQAILDAHGSSKTEP